MYKVNKLSLKLRTLDGKWISFTVENVEIEGLWINQKVCAGDFAKATIEGFQIVDSDGTYTWPI